ncbi:MAG: class I SAM-dependent methyltransferase [Candidatus Binatia bacterium]
MPTRADQLLPFVKGSWILDVGCADHVPEPGSPYWVHGQLCKHFPNVVGIDVNKENVAALKARGFENIYVTSAETFALQRKFDTIVAGEIIEHLSNPGCFFRVCGDHLVDRGRLVLTTPYPFSFLFTLYAFLKFPKTCQNPEHTCWFCPQTLKELAGRYGFQATHWELVEDYRPDDTSRRYRCFVKLIYRLRWIIPKRLRCNTMLFIFQKEGR